MENLDEIGKMMGHDQNTMNMIKKTMKENPQLIENMMKNMMNGDMNLKPNPKTTKIGKKTKPNEKCPCNSDKKYKKCCGSNN